MSLEIGDKAPAFSLATDGGGKITSASLKGKNVVLYFYPKDDTPGCTREACSFRDDLAQFGKKNAVVLGVSLDDAASHAAFKDKYKLPFTLLADTDGAICRAYGVLAPEKSHASRWTFLIDPTGAVKKVFRDVKVDGHSREVLDAL